jgi:hypothetical protein
VTESIPPIEEIPMRLPGLCLLVVMSGTFALAGDGEKPPRPITITITASPAILPVGTSCRVEMIAKDDGSETVTTTYEGKVVEAKDDGVKLTVTSERQERVRKIPHAKPFPMNRLFRNVGIGRPEPGKEKDIWIPSETIRSVTELPKIRA